MVAMNVWPTDAADGAVTSEARWRGMARMWAPSGIAPGIGGELAPSLAGLNLTVQSGACWVDGHYCELTGAQVLTVTANGIVVVRFDPAANTAELIYRDAVSTPAQNPNGTWELMIAQMIGSALTDWRRVGGSGKVLGNWFQYLSADLVVPANQAVDILVTPTMTIPPGCTVETVACVGFTMASAAAVDYSVAWGSATVLHQFTTGGTIYSSSGPNVKTLRVLLAGTGQSGIGKARVNAWGGVAVTCKARASLSVTIWSTEKLP